MTTKEKTLRAALDAIAREAKKPKPDPDRIHALACDALEAAR